MLESILKSSAFFLLSHNYGMSNAPAESVPLGRFCVDSLFLQFPKNNRVKYGVFVREMVRKTKKIRYSAK